MNQLVYASIRRLADAGEGRHAELQGSRRRCDVPAERRVPHRSLQQPARASPRPRPISSRRCSAEAAKFAEQVLTPLNRVGDKEGCRRHDDGSVTTPTGFKDAYQQARRPAAGSASRRRPSSAARACRWCWRRRVNEFLCSANMAFAMYPGLTQGAIAALLRARIGGAEGALSAEAGRRRMGRHHEPDRAAMRHRSRPGAHPRRAAGRRQLQDHPAPRSSSPPASTISPRTSSISCWPASTARRPAPAAFRCSSCRRFLPDADGSARRAQRGVVRLDRREDGHPRQRHLRDELRRRHRLADGRSRTAACRRCSR